MNGDVVTRVFREACKSLGIEDLRFHDLRHTAASWMRMSGADIHTVALVLGHKDLRMVARYQHLSPAYLGEAVGKLEGFGELRCPDVATPKQLPPATPVTIERKSTANGTRTRSLRLERAAC
jgi:hypothetical protein